MCNKKDALLLTVDVTKTTQLVSLTVLVGLTGYLGSDGMPAVDIDCRPFMALCSLSLSAILCTVVLLYCIGEMHGGSYELNRVGIRVNKLLALLFLFGGLFTAINYIVF